MCHTVGSALGVVDVLSILFTQMQVVVVRHQLRERMCGFDNAIRVLVEHFEKITFAWQQLAK
ncbi:hypothetical protein D3C73_1541830 [compost metagenome]